MVEEFRRDDLVPHLHYRLAHPRSRRGLHSSTARHQNDPQVHVADRDRSRVGHAEKGDREFQGCSEIGSQ